MSFEASSFAKSSSEIESRSFCKDSSIAISQLLAALKNRSFAAFSNSERALADNLAGASADHSNAWVSSRRFTCRRGNLRQAHRNPAPYTSPTPERSRASVCPFFVAGDSKPPALFNLRQQFRKPRLRFKCSDPFSLHA